jgi:hypothetical protein
MRELAGRRDRHEAGRDAPPDERRDIAPVDRPHRRPGDEHEDHGARGEPQPGRPGGPDQTDQVGVADEDPGSFEEFAARQERLDDAVG